MSDTKEELRKEVLATIASLRQAVERTAQERATMLENSIAFALVDFSALVQSLEKDDASMQLCAPHLREIIECLDNANNAIAAVVKTLHVRRKFKILKS